MGPHLRKLKRSTVVLHTQDGNTFRGVLVGAHKDCLVLTAAVLLADEGAAELAGDIGIPRANVGWWQESLP